jgi:predicted RNA binding protein YcfA (HicA-like mRNA interferase family)
MGSLVYVVSKGPKTKFPCHASPAPPVERKGLVRLLNKSGFDKTSRGKGSHVVYEKQGPPKVSITVPYGKTLSQHVSGNIASQLGYGSRGDLWREVQK